MGRLRLAITICLSSLALVGCNHSFTVDVKSDPRTGTTVVQSTETSSNSSSQSSFSFPSNSSSTSSSSVWKDTAGGLVNSIVNGRTTVNGKGVRYSSRSGNGVEIKLEAPADITFLKGKPTKWSTNEVVTLSEERNGTTKFGELRPDGTQMVVWIKHGNSFKPGTAEEQKWSDQLLAAFKLDDTPEPDKKKDAANYKLDDPKFAQKLAALHYAKDITELINAKANAPSLTAEEQTALIDLVFGKVHYAKDQKAILLQLIHRKDLSKEASRHLLDNLDHIHCKADQKLIQRELFDAK